MATAVSLFTPKNLSKKQGQQEVDVFSRYLAVLSDSLGASTPVRASRRILWEVKLWWFCLLGKIKINFQEFYKNICTYRLYLLWHIISYDISRKKPFLIGRAVYIVTVTLCYTHKELKRKRFMKHLGRLVLLK